MSEYCWATIEFKKLTPELILNSILWLEEESKWSWDENNKGHILRKEKYRFKIISEDKTLEGGDSKGKLITIKINLDNWDENYATKFWKQIPFKGPFNFTFEEKEANDILPKYASPIFTKKPKKEVYFTHESFILGISQNYIKIESIKVGSGGWPLGLVTPIEKRLIRLSKSINATEGFTQDSVSYPDKSTFYTKKKIKCYKCGKEVRENKAWGYNLKKERFCGSKCLKAFK